jgi:hypothetical protein
VERVLRPSALAALAALVLTACGSGGGVAVEDLSAVAAAARDRQAAAAPETQESEPAADEHAHDTALPAEVPLTPEVLRDRRLPTRSLLPPPPDGQFAATVGPVTPELRERMGESWSSACPVDLTGLRYVTVAFRGFDGLAHTGELVLAEHVAEDVVGVFRTLFEADFPIEEMRLVTTEDHHAPQTGDGNSTAAYNCRSIRGSTRWSEHALGTAIDINPFHNPMLKRGVVTPEKATSYVDRSNVRPGMVVDPGVAVRAFAEIGWKWGGHWTSHQDWMHFSAEGT